MAESLCPIYPEEFQLCIKHLYVLRLEVWRSAFQKCVRHVTCSLSEQACLGRSRLQDNKEESTFFHWLWKMICLHCLWRAKVSKRGLRISCKNRPCKKKEKKILLSRALISLIAPGALTNKCQNLWICEGKSSKTMVNFFYFPWNCLLYAEGKCFKSHWIPSIISCQPGKPRTSYWNLTMTNSCAFVGEINSEPQEVYIPLMNHLRHFRGVILPIQTYSSKLSV